MDYLFIKDFIESIENSGYCVDRLKQRGVKELLADNPDIAKNFPMICCEYTEDSVFESSIHDSKFINDRSHEGDWFVIGDEDEVYCILNLQEHGQYLVIDTIEVNAQMRGKGIGGKIIDIIESVGEEYYNYIEVSPFDTGAINFWESREYVESNNGTWILYIGY